MIVPYTDLPQLRARHSGTIVYARGAFDVIHGGHVGFIEFAKQQGDLLVLGIISDGVVSQVKGPDRPVRRGEDRALVADAIKGTDYVFIVPPPTEAGSSTEMVIELLQPDVFVLFDEEPAYTQHFKSLLSQHDIRLVLDASAKKSSTTSLIQKMKDRSSG
jgi:D-beta-D-heptose 7-phosphate kinase/D-beta-D-heptose 1-phosphate adenosyltransferase